MSATTPTQVWQHGQIAQQKGRELSVYVYIMIHSRSAASNSRYAIIITPTIDAFVMSRDGGGSETEQPRWLLSLIFIARSAGSPRSTRQRLVGRDASRRPAIGRRWQVRATVAPPGGGR